MVTNKAMTEGGGKALEVIPAHFHFGATCTYA